MVTELLCLAKGAGRQRGLFGLLLAVTISGCGDENVSSSDAPSPAPSSPTSSPGTPPTDTGGTTPLEFAELNWGANSEPDLSGYRVYYGTAPGEYAQSFGQGINVGKQTSYVVSDLASGQKYYFAVTAYDTSGNESDYSNEVSKNIP